jgi:hypothetical protein
LPYPIFVSPLQGSLKNSQQSIVRVQKKSPRESYRIEKKQQKSDSFSRADEKRFCIGSAECYVTIINKTDAKVISSDTDDMKKTSFRQI